jgi:HipA-like C-terminal domain
MKIARKSGYSPKRKRPKRQRKPGRAIPPFEIKGRSGFDPTSWNGVIPILKRGRYVLDDRSVIGDAPKNFIWIAHSALAASRPHEYQAWPAYIAKLGHKAYPAESVTEQLMTRVGQVLRLNIADSRLMICAGQLRFMSRFFLQGEDVFSHGAQIVGGYLADDKFVEGVTAEHAEKEVFTFDVICTAIRTIFPQHHSDLLRDLVRMVGFDALVGNKDRHLYNWGVITEPTGALAPRFAPIYDTARGLFWNSTEEDLVKFMEKQSMAGYVRRSRPLIGWHKWNAAKGDLTHFDLVGSIAASDIGYWRLLEDLGKVANESVDTCEGMIDAEFGEVLSRTRRELIKRCLRLRFETYSKVF